MRVLMVGLSVILAVTLAAGGAWANNLVLTNLTIRPRDDSTAYVQFNICWDNSWRYTNINHDAAWVFFKIKPEGRANWEHVTLETNGYIIGTGTVIDVIVPSDPVGCFIRRAGEGAGTLSATNIKVAWNFASNSLVKTDRVRIQAFAVEMVYVAEGEFYVGSGGTETGSFTDGAWASGTTMPFRITSEAALLITNAVGNLWGTSSSGPSTIGAKGLLPADFPKGYAPFYCMKYEITQGQYRDFLNSLTRVQQNTRTTTQLPDYFVMGNWVQGGLPAISKRESIRCPSVVPIQPEPIVFGCDGNNNKIMNETNDAMDRACNFLTWSSGCAVADWAGLRPMTELEYEKACRGPRDPVANEYPWGDTTIIPTTGLSNSGSGLESVASGNCHYDNNIGPYRVGIYATVSSVRQTAGASYWGIMELGGNVWEQAVMVGNGYATSRLFTGLHGDGRLSEQGDADVSFWPVSFSAGGGCRGGSHMNVTANIRVSDRYNTSYSSPYDLGWRGVRTAPAGVGP